MTMLIAGASGAGGGLAWFLEGIRQGRIRDQRWRKSVLEVSVAALTAACMAAVLIPDGASIRWSIGSGFVLGVCASGVLQTIRKRITKVIEAMIGDL